MMHVWDGYDVHNCMVYSINCLQYKVFTLDPSNYPADEMKEFVTTLHSNDQHYGNMITVILCFVIVLL